MEYYGNCWRYFRHKKKKNSKNLFICSVEIIRLSDKTFKETIKDVELSVLRSTTKEGYISLDPSKPLPHEYEEGKMTRYNDNSIYIRKYNVVDAENVATSVSPADNENDNYISLASEYATQVMPETRYQSRIDSDWMKVSLNSTRYEEMTLRHDDATTKIEFAQSKLAPETYMYPNESLAKPLPFVENEKMRITPNPVTIDAPEVDKLLNGGKIIKFINCGEWLDRIQHVSHAQTNSTPNGSGQIQINRLWVRLWNGQLFFVIYF